MSRLDQLRPDLIATMPKHSSGAVIDPRYVPETQRPAYLAKWGQWLRSHPRSEWEPWMHGLVAEMRSRRPS